MSYVILKRYYDKHPEDREWMTGCTMTLFVLLCVAFSLYAMLHKPVTKTYTLTEGATVFQVSVGSEKAPEKWYLNYKDCNDLSSKMPGIELLDTLIVVYKGKKYEWDGCTKNQPYQFSLEGPVTPTPTKTKSP